MLRSEYSPISRLDPVNVIDISSNLERCMLITCIMVESTLRRSRHHVVGDGSYYRRMLFTHQLHCLGGTAKTTEKIDAESAAGMDRQSDGTRDFRFHSMLPWNLKL